MTWPFGDGLQPFSCDVIVADPPWFFENYSEAGTKKGAAQHYDLMSAADIKVLPVGQIARRDCVLLLWTCGWAMANGTAQAVARAWGFDPISEMVWNKRTASGAFRVGTGYRVRSMHEPILVCVTGDQEHKAFPSAFDALAREHSRKPVEFYDIVRRCTPKAMQRADLFADMRMPEAHDGFVRWGNPHRSAA